MIQILAITGPIYMAIALGYATTRGGLFTRADMRVFGQFVIRLALPAMLFNALSQRQIGEILNPSYVLAYLAGTLALLGLCLVWGKRSGLSATDSVVAAMGGLLSTVTVPCERAMMAISLAISSGDSTQSTQPVSMADCGMPAYLAVCGSWAKV